MTKVNGFIALLPSHFPLKCICQAIHSELMKFKTLQDNLRKHLSQQIQRGNLTGVELAAKTGFRQAHISNFLNCRRGLSLQAMDRVLSVQKLSVLDLLDPAEINRRAGILSPNDEKFQNVVLTEARIAASEPVINNTMVKEILKFRTSFLRSLRSCFHGERHGWDRFVAINAAARDGMSMFPRMLPGATTLIDRHYNSLRRYRKDESNMYAVRKADGSCSIRYVEVVERNLLLRPHNHSFPVELMPMAFGFSPSDYIVGRVCFVGIET